MELNKVIETIQSHRSIRKYRGPPGKEDLEAIVNSAIRAPTAWNLMPLSIQVITDPQLLGAIGDAVGGQEHVKNAPVLLSFSVDYAKIINALGQLGIEKPGLAVEWVVTAAVDAGIMAGWAALAAESLGYGVSFIALYSNPCRVAEILELPKRVIPLVGLVIGVPGEEPPVRSRVHPEGVVGVNGYGKNPVEKARHIVELYGSRAKRLLAYVAGRGGYLERVSAELRKCLE